MVTVRIAVTGTPAQMLSDMAASAATPARVERAAQRANEVAGDSD
jgi:hypothetical protein